MLTPKFKRELITRPIDREDYEVLKETMGTIDAHGVSHVPTLEEFKAMGVTRCIGHRNIFTGEWEGNQSDTPFYVMKVKQQ